MHCTMLWQHHTCHARTIATTQECAKVAGVGDAINGDQERCDTIACLQHVGKRCLFQLCSKRDDSLRCFTARCVFQRAARNFKNGNTMCVRNLFDVIKNRRSINVGCHPDFANLALLANQQFTNCLTTFYLFSTEALGNRRITTWCFTATSTWKWSGTTSLWTRSIIMRERRSTA